MSDRFKTYIITGHFGSGKTEFCVNLALHLAEFGATTIADLDVVNPYFRSREKASWLEKRGISVVGDNLDNNTGQDLPAVSFGFLSQIGKGNVIMDLGGGLSGLRLLAACYDAIINNEFEFLCVVNPFRPDTDTAEKMADFVRSVNADAKLRITGLVNNGHMLRETAVAHVLDSQEIVKEVADILKLPIRYTLLQNNIYKKIGNKIQSDEILTFDKLQMRENWL